MAGRRSELVRQAVADAEHLRQHHQGPLHPHPQGRFLLGLCPEQPDRRRLSTGPPRVRPTSRTGAPPAPATRWRTWSPAVSRSSTRCRMPPVADFKYYQYSWYVNDQWKATRRLTITAGLRFEHMGNWVPPSGPGLAVWDQSTYDNTSAAGAWTGLQWNAINSSIPMSGFPSKPHLLRTARRRGLRSVRQRQDRPARRLGPVSLPARLQQRQRRRPIHAPLNVPQVWAPPGAAASAGTSSTSTPRRWARRVSARASNGILTMGDAIHAVHRHLQLHHLAAGTLALRGRVPVFGQPVEGPDAARAACRTSTTDPAGCVLQTGSDDGPDQRSCFQQLPDQRLLSLAQLHGDDADRPRQLLELQRVHRVVAEADRAVHLHRELHLQQGARYPRQSDRQRTRVRAILCTRTRLAQNYGVLAWDHTHIFNAAYVINLPSPVHGNKFVGGAVNGWVLSGITQLQSGAPIQPNTNGTLNVQWPGNFTSQRYLGTNAPTHLPQGHLRSAQQPVVRPVLQPELLRAADRRGERRYHLAVHPRTRVLQQRSRDLQELQDHGAPEAPVEVLGVQLPEPPAAAVRCQRRQRGHLVELQQQRDISPNQPEHVRPTASPHLHGGPSRDRVRGQVQLLSLSLEAFSQGARRRPGPFFVEVILRSWC